MADRSGAHITEDIGDLLVGQRAGERGHQRTAFARWRRNAVKNNSDRIAGIGRVDCGRTREINRRGARHARMTSGAGSGEDHRGAAGSVRGG